MGRREEAPSLALSKLDAAARHNRVLLHALQTAHPVLHRGSKRFIQCVTFALSGGTVEATVYLTGSPEPIGPDLITLAPEVK